MRFSARKNRRNDHAGPRRPLARFHLNRLEDRVVPAFPFGLGSTGVEMGHDVAVDAAGNVYLAGRFDSANLDFDPGAGVARLSLVGVGGTFLAKYDAGGTFLWARRVSGNGSAGVGDGNVAVGPDGFVYFAGPLSGSGSITGVDSATRTEYVVRAGLSSATAQDALVAKFDPGGGLVWVNQFQGGPGQATQPKALAVDAGGAAYVTGAHGPLNTYIVSGGDAFVAKVNGDGSPAWTRSFGAAGEDVGFAIAAGSDGAYVTGAFAGAVAFGGTTLTSRGEDDAFVTRLNANGDVLWARRAGGAASDRGRGIGVYWDSQMAAESVNITGEFNRFVTPGGPADFGDPTNPGDTGATTLTSLGAGDVFVSSLTAAGDFLWTRQFGGTGAEHPTGLAVGADGGVYTTGQFSTTVDFDLHNTYPDGRDRLAADAASVYVAKLDAGGGFAWVRHLGPPPGSKSGGALSWGLAWNATSNAVFVSGYYSDTFDTGEGTITSTKNGGLDLFVARVTQPNPPSSNPAKFYVVDDASADRTYEYDAAGGAIENYTLGSGNTAPRGAASTAAGDTVWVVDANKKVYVYDTAGGLLGSWTAGSLASTATVEGITVFGSDVWLVDSKQDKVFRYTGAASLRSGNQNAASSFSLNSGNTNPKDLVTDGTSIWVVNDGSPDKVFKYTLAGSLLGSWTIDAANSSPTGITLDPAAVGHLWIVDNGTDRVYQYDGAAGRTSGSQSAGAVFALAAGNTNPQGIADPPAGNTNPQGTTAPPAQQVYLAADEYDFAPIDLLSRRGKAKWI